MADFSYCWHPFSFSGRASRSDWWLSLFVYVAVHLIASPILRILSQKETSGFAIATYLIVFFLPLAWAMMATTVRRLHDRGRSGWFIFISLVPVLGAILLVIECGFLPRHELSSPRPLPFTA
jgi:uncharacterized membrane protein YhaH (DUF805 family)